MSHDAMTARWKPGRLYGSVEHVKDTTTRSLRRARFRSSETPATAKTLASRFSSSRTVAGRLAEAQLHWHSNRAKNLSRDQFAVSHEVTNEQQLSRCNDPVSREIRE